MEYDVLSVSFDLVQHASAIETSGGSEYCIYNLHGGLVGENQREVHCIAHRLKAFCAILRFCTHEDFWQ